MIKWKNPSVGYVHVVLHAISEFVVILSASGTAIGDESYNELQQGGVSHIAKIFVGSDRIFSSMMDRQIFVKD